MFGSFSKQVFASFSYSQTTETFGHTHDACADQTQRQEHCIIEALHVVVDTFRIRARVSR